MKPILFPEANKFLAPPEPDKGAAVPALPIEPISVHTNMQVCTTCWQLTPEERWAVFYGGKVWLQLLSGESQPPAKITVASPFTTPSK